MATTATASTNPGIFTAEGVVSIESTDGFSTRFYSDGFLVGRILDFNGVLHFQQYVGRDDETGEQEFETIARQAKVVG